VSRDDFANRYGAFLGSLQRLGLLDRGAAAAAQVTLPNVEAYITDLTARVRSVTIWNCVYKLRRAAQLLAPKVDFSWLAEIEKDLALVMQPRSKFDRLVFTERLVEAGLTLVSEAKEFAKNDLTRARGVRNGLMIALLALCPIRPKNFAALEIGQTFKEIHATWWIALPRITTKSRRRDERRVPSLLNRYIDPYLHQSRPVLLGSRPPTNALWISSTTGRLNERPRSWRATLLHARPWDLKPRQRNLTPVLRRPVEPATESGHRSTPLACPLCANRRHTRCSKQRPYLITASARANFRVAKR
jgi:hypothetical protein